jgi:selenium metabolism protein YedF
VTIQTVDARGLACPQPVIRSRKAMAEATQVVTLVDNETAVINVSRMAQKAGWQVEVTQEDGDFRLEMIRGAAPASARQPAPMPAIGHAESLPGPLVLVIAQDSMGRGSPELGNILIRGFFHTMGEVEPLPQTVIFFNTGVKLACQGSPVLDDLRALEAKGIEILVCGTCLNYFELTDDLAAGQVSNMYDIAETMLRAGKVVNL